MEMFDTYVLTKVRLDDNGSVISANVRKFDTHCVEAHRDADVADEFGKFGVEDDPQEEQ